MSTPGTVDSALPFLFDRIPTSVAIALLLLLVARRIALVLQQVTATYVALFSRNPQRADRALAVLRALRGLPDHQKLSRASRVGKHKNASTKPPKLS